MNISHKGLLHKEDLSASSLLRARGDVRRWRSGPLSTPERSPKAHWPRRVAPGMWPSCPRRKPGVGTYGPFLRSSSLLVERDHGGGSRCPAFLSPLLPSWASTDACSLKNWGDCKPSPAYSSELALTPFLREDPLTSFSCSLGFLSLRVLPEV